MTGQVAMIRMAQLFAEMNIKPRIFFEPYGKFDAGWYCIVQRLHDPSNQYRQILASGTTPDEAAYMLYAKLAAMTPDAIAAQL